jgi:hypothetical protein
MIHSIKNNQNFSIKILKRVEITVDYLLFFIIFISLLKINPIVIPLHRNFSLIIVF